MHTTYNSDQTATRLQTAPLGALGGGALPKNQSEHICNVNQVISEETSHFKVILKVDVVWTVGNKKQCAFFPSSPTSHQQ